MSGLDEKGLEAATRVYAKTVSKDPDACAPEKRL